MFQVIYFDFAADGINFASIWDGPGLPFAGSLIMISVDILLYLFLAYYLDNVIPSMPTSVFPLIFALFIIITITYCYSDNWLQHCLPFLPDFIIFPFPSIVHFMIDMHQDYFL